MNAREELQSLPAATAREALYILGAAHWPPETTLDAIRHIQPAIDQALRRACQLGAEAASELWEDALDRKLDVQRRFLYLNWTKPGRQ